MNDNFIPVAIDINYLQNQQDAEGQYFRKIAEQGHYAGRTKPTPTRQGLYIATIDGTLLSSVNTTDASKVKEVMHRANRAWQMGGKKQTKKFMEKLERDPGLNVGFPEGGLILRETMRDLPRAKEPLHKTWRHNFDYCWLTKNEVAQFAPTQTKVGHSYEVPAKTASRFATFHLVDQVKGEADAWELENVKSVLSATVKSVDGSKVTIQVEGNARCTQSATGEKNPYSGARVNEERGVEAKIAGWLIYDTESQSFSKFDLIGFGERWGTATYNFRHRDKHRSPIGFAFEMLPSKPENKIRPKFLYWDYFGTAEK